MPLHIASSDWEWLRQFSRFSPRQVVALMSGMEKQPLLRSPAFTPIGRSP